jgi:hypothetical protein
LWNLIFSIKEEFIFFWQCLGSNESWRLWWWWVSEEKILLFYELNGIFEFKKKSFLQKKASTDFCKMALLTS